MKGKYEIRIENKRIIYQFTIKRNITIIRGESATGKTTLVEMLQSYEQDHEESGITVHCQKRCTVLTDVRWQENLETIHDSIVFIDENYYFMRSREFASAIRLSDNYYVLVTRDNLYNLPYSVDEIYGIHVSRKYSNLKKTYNELYHIYGDIPAASEQKGVCIITEDLNSGYDFFSAVSDGACISAGGKSNVYQKAADTKLPCLIMADGAAFGPEMEKMMEMVHAGYQVSMYLPESFEWLILKSGIINDRETRNVMETPEDYIESSRYFSWERFFTAILTEKSAGTYYQYQKSSLNKHYLHEKERKAILKVLPEKIRNMIVVKDSDKMSGIS